jgi:hypothetical protein
MKTDDLVTRMKRVAVLPEGERRLADVMTAAGKGRPQGGRPPGAQSGSPT